MILDIFKMRYVSNNDLIIDISKNLIQFSAQLLPNKLYFLSVQRVITPMECYFVIQSVDFFAKHQVKRNSQPHILALQMTITAQIYLRVMRYVLEMLRFPLAQKWGVSFLGPRSPLKDAGKELGLHDMQCRGEGHAFPDFQQVVVKNKG